MTKVGGERKRSSWVGAGLGFKGGGLLAPSEVGSATGEAGGRGGGPDCQIAFSPGLEIIHAILNARIFCVTEL